MTKHMKGKTMQKLIAAYSLARKLGFALALIGIGYLLGNAFPTFEVHPVGYDHAVDNPLSLGPFMEKFNDFNDEVE